MAKSWRNVNLRNMNKSISVAVQPLWRSAIRLLGKKSNNFGSQIPDFEISSDVIIPLELRSKFTDEFSLSAETFPLTLPRATSFPLHLSLISDRRFPFPALGLIHVSNSISMPSKALSGVFEVSCRATEFIEKSAGWFFTIETKYAKSGELAWSEKSVYLSRKPKSKSSAKKSKKVVELLEGETIDLGLVGLRDARTYAKLSGDYNPIHLSNASAKIFGMPSAIIHGMWSQAKIASELSTLRPISAIECDFRSPLLLPTEVHLVWKETESRIHFELQSPDKTKIYVSGWTY